MAAQVNLPKILLAAFALETVAHLQGREKSLLPLADYLRELHHAALNDRLTDTFIRQAVLKENI